MALDLYLLTPVTQHIATIACAIGIYLLYSNKEVIAINMFF